MERLFRPDSFLRDITCPCLSEIHGEGLFARQFIEAGCLLRFSCRKKIRGDKRYLGEYINHSKTPNLRILKVLIISKSDFCDLIAEVVQDIRMNDELTINYNKLDLQVYSVKRSKDGFQRI